MFNVTTKHTIKPNSMIHKLLKVASQTPVYCDDFGDAFFTCDRLEAIQKKRGRPSKESGKDYTGCGITELGLIWLSDLDSGKTLTITETRTYSSSRKRL